MNDGKLPIFALGSVLFPGGLLSLQVFEPRYLDMVKRCMADGLPFGVCLIREGSETGAAASVHPIGTQARILDFDLLDNGLLGITARGEHRFEVIETETRADQLIVARTRVLEDEPSRSVPAEHEHLSDVARALLEHLGSDQLVADGLFEDATWVGHRLAEVLPMPAADRQALLELDDPLYRLVRVAGVVENLVESEPPD